MPGPVEIVSVTTEPFVSRVPAVGIWAVTVPFGLDEPAKTYCGTRPRLWRFAWAVAFGWPISAGTFGPELELCFSTSAYTSAAMAAAATSATSSAHGQTGLRREPGGSTIAPGGMMPVVFGSQ